MKKIISVTIKCGELTCIDARNGDTCEYLFRTNTKKCYCSLFNEDDLFRTNNSNYMRCIPCREHESSEG